MNRVTLIGNLGADPEIRKAGQHDLMQLSVATSEKHGEKETTQWHRVQVWNQMIEKMGVLRKGDRVFVHGKIRYGSYEKNGQKIYTTDIVAQTAHKIAKSETQSTPSGNDFSDDLPF